MTLGIESDSPFDAASDRKSSLMAASHWSGHNIVFPGGSGVANPGSAYAWERGNSIFRYADLATRLGRFSSCSKCHEHSYMVNRRHNSTGGLAFLASNFSGKLVSRFGKSITFYLLSFRLARSGAESSLNTRDCLAASAPF